MTEASRYARQVVLPQVGAAGQAALGAARVLVVGAGGLGVPVLQYLAGAGVGAITIVDGDTVEEINLHRQPLYRMADLGHPKAVAAARALAATNPGPRVEPRPVWLDPANAPALVAAADVVLDCADSFAVSFTLSDACRDAGRPLISGSALGMAGYAGGFCGGAPSLRAVFPDLPAAAGTCATAGILGPVVAVIGALQAQMALAVLLGLAPSPLGQMTTFDGATFRAGGFRFDGTPEPVAARRFVAASQIGPGDMVVDLRDEAPVPFRADAGRMPPGGPATLTPPPGTARVVLACRTGLRAFHAAEALAGHWDGKIALHAVTPG